MNETAPTMDIFIAQRLLMVGEDECWVYPSGRSSTGYAHYYEKPNRTLSAHRVSFEVMFQHPGHLCVLHRCDNRPCANPFHLFLGTKGDNARDAMAKDRHCRGERNGQARLTEDQVRAIRSDGRKQGAIAAEYGIRQTTVSEIKHGNLWGHVK